MAGLRILAVVLCLCIAVQATKLRSPIFNVLNYGAVADGHVLNTKAIESAIAALKQAGSGTLYFPLPRDQAGVYLSGPFNLTSHCTLYLEKDVTLLASDVIADWPVIPALPSYGQGRDHLGPRYTSFIHGEHLEDVKLVGEDPKTSIIDGQGATWWHMHKNKTEKFTRGSLVEFLYTSKIEIASLTLRNSPFWTVHPWASEHIHVHDCNILAPLDSPNTDGVDPDSSSDVVIEHNVISVGDDCIAIKSGWDNPGLEFNRPTRDVVIRWNEFTTTSSSGIAIGSEMSGGVTNVTVYDMIIHEGASGIRIKSAPGRGAFVTDIHYKNVTVTKAKIGIQFDDNYKDHAHSYDPTKLPIVRDIFVSDFTVAATTYMGVGLSGLKDSPMSNLVFANVHVKTNPLELGWVCAYVSGTVHEVSPTPCADLKPV